MTPAAILGRIVQVLGTLPPEVVSAIGKVIENIVAGDKAGAEKAANLAAMKASFAAAAKAGRKLRGG